MSKRELYGLVFVRKVTNGIIRNYCKQTNEGGNNSVLTFISKLDERETEIMIQELTTRIMLGYNSNDPYESDTVEHMNILFQYPNMDIDGVLLIPMQDLKELLQEWLDFINS